MIEESAVSPITSAAPIPPRWANPAACRLPWLDVEPARAEHAQERDRGLRARVECNRADVVHRHFREDGHRRHRTIGRNRKARDDSIVVPRILDGRNQPEIDVVRVQKRGTFRRHVEPQSEPICLIFEPVDERAVEKLTLRVDRHVGSAYSVR